jgi:hypothetical protein
MGYDFGCDDKFWKFISETFVKNWKPVRKPLDPYDSWCGLMYFERNNVNTISFYPSYNAILAVTLTIFGMALYTIQSK